MSLISDVRQELSALELSGRRLRQFGLMIGGILLLLALWFHLRKEAVNIAMVLYAAGSLLFVFGLIRPQLLSGIYRVWMGLAFVMGWFVSRLLLVIIYFLVLTPIALTARLFGKKMLDIDFSQKKSSYWKAVDQNIKRDYEKMY